MKDRNHGLLIFLTFVLLIAAGAVALKSPLVHHSQGILFLDALFISTSAACVTGLTPLPISGFNFSGQMIILILVQVGAIGIMTFTASFILFYRGELDLQKRIMATQLSVSPNLSDIEAVLKTVISFTLITETAGFFVLVIGFLLDGFSLPASTYYAVFHSISAFCNAGFSPFDSSLQNSGSLVQIATALLIIMGGIGYYVVFDCLEWIKRKDRLSIHTKIVVTATLMCIVSGAALLSLTESGDLSLRDALFQSVTARTAGFNTIVVCELQSASLLILVILMIIGAAPGSTGGGIKLTTFWVICSMAYNTIRGENKLVLFDRRLPEKDIIRACTVTALYLAFLCVCVGFLLYFEGLDFFSTLFETTSAIGTVGLSMGITPKFGAPGKIILIAAMLGGRIGPAVLVIMLFRSPKEGHVEYPAERVILG